MKNRWFTLQWPLSVILKRVTWFGPVYVCSVNNYTAFQFMPWMEKKENFCALIIRHVQNKRRNYGCITVTMRDCDCIEVKNRWRYKDILCFITHLSVIWLLYIRIQAISCFSRCMCIILKSHVTAFQWTVNSLRDMRAPWPCPWYGHCYRVERIASVIR